MDDDIANELRALAKGHAHRSETARLRDIFDDIEYALRSGVSRAAILNLLHRKGFTLTPKGFEKALYVIRKERNTTQYPMPNKMHHPTAEYTEQPMHDKTKISNESELVGLTPKQRREKIADAFIKPDTINPRIQRLLDKNDEDSGH